jgi:hypothetical protein
VDNAIAYALRGFDCREIGFIGCNELTCAALKLIGYW